MKQVLQGSAHRVRCPPQGFTKPLFLFPHLSCLCTNQGVAVRKCEGLLLKVTNRPTHPQRIKKHTQISLRCMRVCLKYEEKKSIMKLLINPVEYKCWFIHSKHTNLSEARPGAANNPDEDSAASIIISVIITAVLFPAKLQKNRLTICCLMEPLCHL